MNDNDIRRRAGLDFWDAQHDQFKGFELVPHAYRLLAEGQPVALKRVAAAASWSLQDVEATLGRQPGVDWDEQGRLVAFGLTLRPTRHRFTFDGRTVYAFCASDALTFPVILGRSGVLESSSPITGRPIKVELTPQRVEKVEASSAVVSLVRPERFEDVRKEICALGLFFVSTDEAADWLAAHPDGMLHSVEDDFELHREMMEQIGWAHAGRTAR